MKHLIVQSRSRQFPLKADEKGPIMVDPCAGLSGKQLKACEKKHN